MDLLVNIITLTPCCLKGLLFVAILLSFHFINIECWVKCMCECAVNIEKIIPFFSET